MTINRERKREIEQVLHDIVFKGTGTDTTQVQAQVQVRVSQVLQVRVSQVLQVPVLVLGGGTHIVRLLPFLRHIITITGLLHLAGTPAQVRVVQNHLLVAHLVAVDRPSLPLHLPLQAAAVVDCKCYNKIFIK